MYTWGCCCCGSVASAASSTAPAITPSHDVADGWPDGLGGKVAQKGARTLSELEFQIALPQRRRFDEALNVALSKPLSLMLGDRGFEFPSLPPASPSQQQIAVGKVSPDPDHIRALACCLPPGTWR